MRNESGRIVGLVSAGILQTDLAERWRSQWPTIAAVSAAALAISLVGVWFIRRRLLRQTHGLRPDELRVMYEHHDAILHSVSEGLIVLDRSGVALVNDEARRLLALPPGPVDRADLPEFLRTYNPGARDEVHVTDERVLVVNRSPVDRSRGNSEVVTIRDRTELQGALGELSSLQVLTEILAVAGPRGRQQAAHRGHHGRDGAAGGSGEVRHQRTRSCPNNSSTGCPVPSASPHWSRCCSASPPRPTNAASS